jgi:hypothetical protein
MLSYFGDEACIILLFPEGSNGESCECANNGSRRFSEGACKAFPRSRGGLPLEVLLICRDGQFVATVVLGMAAVAGDAVEGDVVFDDQPVELLP